MVQKKDNLLYWSKESRLIPKGFTNGRRGGMEEWRDSNNPNPEHYEQENTATFSKSNRHQHWGFRGEVERQWVGKEMVGRRSAYSV
jgi:hypothetical protein